MSDLPHELLQDAVFERRGSFTLAAEKAREKMRRFQLENPRRYLLQVIAGVVASGAQGIDVATQEGDLLTYTLTVDFDGPGYTAQELRDLYDAVFLPGDEPATDRLRELALGVLACQGLPARRLEIRSNGATWLWEGAETTVVPEGAPPGHRVSVVGPGNADEAKLLQDACQAVPVPLRLNGQPVNSPHRRWAAAVPWPAHPFRIPEGEGVVGLPYRDLDASRIAFYRHGVQFATRKLPELRPPISLAVEAPRLRRNVSHTDVVEDEGWRDLMAALPGVVTDLGRALATREAPAYHREEVRSFLLHALVEWLPPEIAAQPAEAWPPELRPLAQVRLFADRRGQRVSLEEVLRQAGAGGLVSTISRRMPYAPLGDWLLLNPSSEEQAVLERYVRLVDVEDALPGLLRRGGAPPQAAPPPLAANPLARARRAGILLVVDDRPPDGRCRLRSREGLQEFELHGWSLDVETDGGLQAATAALQEGAPSLFRRLLEAVPTETGARRARLREHLLAWWRSRLDPALGDVPPADPAERLALCRRTLGEEAWTARVFDTRAGAGVSLADAATWIAEGGTLAVAVGGPRRPGDHALDGTPAQLAFLSRVFGADAVVRATLRVAEQGALAAPKPAPPSAPTPEAADWLEWQKALPRRPSLASHAFHEGPLAGFLAVRTEPDELIILRGDSVQALETLFGRTVVGWVQTPPVEESGWTPDEERILHGQLDLLFARLAEAMATLAPSSAEYAVGRLRLLEHLVASPGRVRARLEADSRDDALIRLRFLPLVGEGLGSLADLWPEVQRLGYLPVCREMWPESAGNRPVPLVGTRVPEAFYERLFLKVGSAGATETETLPFRLLQAAARELRQARARGDYRVSEAVLDGLEWSDGGADPVIHDARTGKTLVNRSHRAIRRLTGRFAEDPAVAGLLASAIFSAVNRALEDVGDEDEVRFLEALLDISS